MVSPESRAPPPGSGGGQGSRWGHWQLELCQSPDSTCILCMGGGGPCGATRDVAFPAPTRPLPHPAATPPPPPRPRHPAPGRGAEVTWRWRSRPGRRRDLTQPSGRQENVTEARSPSAKTASLAESLARREGGGLGGAAERQGLRAGGGCWRRRELRPFKAVSAHSRRAWASQEWTVTSPHMPPLPTPDTAGALESGLPFP